MSHSMVSYQEDFKKIPTLIIMETRRKFLQERPLPRC